MRHIRFKFTAILCLIVLVLATKECSADSALNRYIGNEGYTRINGPSNQFLIGSIVTKNTKKVLLVFNKEDKHTLGAPLFNPKSSEVQWVDAMMADAEGSYEETNSTELGLTPTWLTAELSRHTEYKYGVVAKRVHSYTLNLGKYMTCNAPANLAHLRTVLPKDSKNKLITAVIAAEEIVYTFHGTGKQGVEARAVIQIPVQFQASTSWVDGQTMSFKGTQAAPIAIGYRENKVAHDKAGNILINNTEIKETVVIDCSTSTIWFPGNTEVTLTVEDQDPAGYAVDFVGRVPSMLSQDGSFGDFRYVKDQGLIVAAALGPKNTGGGAQGLRTYKFITPIRDVNSPMFALTVQDANRDWGGGLPREHNALTIKPYDPASPNRVDLLTGNCRCPMSLAWVSRSGLLITPCSM